MRLSSFFVVTVTCIGVLASTDVSAEVHISCPTSVSTQPAVVNDVPDGWHANQRSTSSYVRGVSISVGPPDGLGDLKPDIRTIKGGRSFSWQFVQAKHDAGVWLSCGYENTVALSQLLPKGLSKCRAILSTTRDGYPNVVVSCQ